MKFGYPFCDALYIARECQKLAVSLLVLFEFVIEQRLLDTNEGKQLS
jgi:hypothetical protein